jgi:hypothetical protein
MSAARKLFSCGLTLVACLTIASTPAAGQSKAKHKHYPVSTDRAVSVTRTVLIDQGYHVVRVERAGATQVVYYRRGNMGRGKGKGPLRRMVIRTVRDRVVFENAEPSVLVDIDIKLKL